VLCRSWVLSHIAAIQRVAASKVSKSRDGGSATSMHGFVLAVFRARGRSME